MRRPSKLIHSGTPRDTIALANAETGCFGKRRCERKQAYAYAKKMRNECMKPGDEFMSAYKCTNCGHYHIGHKPVRLRFEREISNVGYAQP